ncbi:MAG: 3'(2'),5'-bisphosphate nucleotidase CysQ [Rhodothalassiaceae bacterium]
MKNADLLESVIAAAIAACHEIRDVASGRIDVREKSDLSPVTIADERAETVILEALRRLDPDAVIVAEEEAAAGRLPERTDGPFWLVDPLDGTKEFLKGGEDYTVNIARIEGGIPTLGVVACPANGRLFAGLAGTGAFEAQVADDGKVGPRRRIATVPCKGTPRIVASKSHRNAETDAWLENYPDAKLVSIGSSLKFCLIATGEADLYPRLGPTMEWDTAAGDAVLRAAGGRTLDARGRIFGYYKPGFRNGYFIACGDPDFEPAPIES